MSRIYKAFISGLDRFVPSPARPLWDHPAGPKTVFFWAPLFKWGLVIAGLGDALNRPAHLISEKQCLSLFLTGAIWSRYSVVIIPKNWSLFSVNVFVALLNGYQLGRAFNYRNSLAASGGKK